MIYIKKGVKALLSSMLPQKVREGVLRLGIAISPDEFLEAAYRRANAPHHRCSLQALNKRGFYPDYAVDVGAYEGEWTRMAKKIWPDCQFMMIEPNIEKKLKLTDAAKQTSSQVIHELLGSKHGKTVEFQIMRSGSSVFPEQSNVPRIVEERKLTTLDRLISDRKIDLLKIDAQGYEMEILKGAGKILSDVDAIILELSLIEINKGAPLLPEVLSFMVSRGFLIYDIVEFHRRPIDKALWQIDCLFVPASSPLRSNKFLS